MNLLIVDDRPADRWLLRRQLEAERHTVVEASDGEEALQALHQLTVDAIISDALMPNMDGFRLCLEIRRRERTAALPFIIHTGSSDIDADRKLALDAGADACVPKPASNHLLLDVIHRARHTRAAPGSASPMPPEELSIIKRYSSSLVAKLEAKNNDLEQALAGLRATEARFHGTLDRMLEGCQILGPDWRYIYLNDAAAWHGQRKKEELVGRTLMECYPGFERSEVFTVMERCMTRREGARVENDFAYEDGTQASFELSIQPVPEGLFILSLDITERKKAARKIRDQLDELLRWQEVMLNREERIQALKTEVNALLAEQGRPSRYPSAIPS